MPEHSSETPLPPIAADAPTIRAQIRRVGLTLVATPIGNLADISQRAIDALRSAESILCEDTRVTARLCAAHDIVTRLEPLHDHNEDARTPALIARLAAGAAIALVSDAGTPLVSDPGYRLVRAAIAAGVPVHAVPGANAALMALTLSGLPPHPFLFLGFAPARAAARLAAYRQLRGAERAGLAATLIWHEAPHRTAEALTDLAACFGDRPAAVARELTKHYEELRRDSLPALAAYYAANPARGEVVLLVGPAPAEEVDAQDVDTMLREALAHMSLKDAAAAVATATGLARKAVYARALEIEGKARGSAASPDEMDPA